MSNNRPRAVDPKRNGDEALNVADFKIDDILNIPGDQLLAEVAEDFGDPAFLAAQFDSIALPTVSSHNRSGVNQGGAMTTFPAQPAALGAASVRALSRPPPATRSFFRAALAMLAEWLVVPLRRPIFLGTFSTVLLAAALTAGIYPLLVNRSDDRMTALSQDKPFTQLPAPALSGPLRTSNPAPVGPPADQSSEEVERVLRQALLAERNQLRTVTDGNDQATRLGPDRRASPPPSALVAPRAPAQQLAVATPATARPPSAEGVTGFFVQLSEPNSPAETLSTLQALKSKHAVLKGHLPFIRRKDEGERGVLYVVQVGPFKSSDDADKLCKQLKTADGICFVTRN